MLQGIGPNLSPGNPYGQFAIGCAGSGQLHSALSAVTFAERTLHQSLIELSERSHQSVILTLSILEKVQAVEKVFHDLDETIAGFQKRSTLHCKSGCGKCCFKPDIEATALEFLPFAHYLYEHELAYDWFEKLKSSDQEICHILNPSKAGAGLCSEYVHRGLICRLFGYSARTDKYGARELVTCQIIKTEQREAYEKTQVRVKNDQEPVPVMNHYYMQLHAIDPELARNFYPINLAIRKAIETILQYYAYRD